MARIGWIPATFWMTPAMQAAEPEVVFFGAMPARSADYYAASALMPPRGNKAAYIYFLLACDGSLLYVGKARTPGNRFDKHRRKEWWGEVVTLLLVRVSGSTLEEANLLALHVESLALRQLNPVYNIAGVNPRPRGSRGGVR